ncbi:hypothetical protein SAMN05216357_10251 [Porphyromonadaceae bacterium KH3CP3RA]|nr:hypothetical protein SAMN05216357_10251 [Porphyromonadaceae bacterium KH3CP3RA]
MMSDERETGELGDWGERASRKVGKRRVGDEEICGV